MTAPSYANAVFAALAQHRLQQQEEEKIKKSQTLNLGSILAGALLGGLTSGGGNALQGILQGGLAGAGSSELEGGVGVAKGAMAGLQQGQNVKNQYIQQLAQQQINKDSNLTESQKSVYSAYPEKYTDYIEKTIQKPTSELDMFKYIEPAGLYDDQTMLDTETGSKVFNFQSKLLPGITAWRFKKGVNPFAMFGGNQ